MGCDRDLTAVTRNSGARNDNLPHARKKLSQADAYMLSSVSVDVSIIQLVDGNVGVQAMLPKHIFVK